MNNNLYSQIPSDSPSLPGNDLCLVESAGSPSEEEGRLAGIPVKNNLEPCVAHFSLSPGEVEYRTIGERDIVENNSINAWVQCGEEQLFKAVSSDNYEEVQRCLAEGVRPNFQVNNIPILALAVRNEKFDIVRILLKKGADPDVLLHDESVPGFLEKAYLNQHYEVAQNLLDNGHPIDKDRLFEFFKYVVIRRYSTGIEFCLKNGIDVNRIYSNCSPIVDLLWRSVKTLGSKECSFERSLRVMVKYGADIENVVWKGKQYSLLSCYLELRNTANFFVKNGNYDYSWLRELLLSRCRVSDEVVRKVRSLRDNRGVLVSLARHLNVPGDIEVLPNKLLVQKILRVMEIMSGSPRGGSLKNLSLGVIARNIFHNRKPDKAIEHLPLPVIVKTRLKEFIDPTPDCVDNS